MYEGESRNLAVFLPFHLIPSIFSLAHPTPTDSKIRIKNERILPVGVKGVIGGERIGGRGRGTREGPPPPTPPPMDTPRLPDAP